MKSLYETERLKLVILDESFAEKVLKYYQDNMLFLHEWEPLRLQGFYTIENQMLTLKIEKEAFDMGLMVRFWLFKKDDENFDNPIGTVAITNIIRGIFKSCYLGYKLSEKECNKGYMTEAVKKIIEIAFVDMKLHRIEANIIPRNYQSIRVVEKLGFLNEGLSKKYLKINDVWEDHFHLVMIND